jgi:hypothetical protein
VTTATIIAAVAALLAILALLGSALILQRVSRPQQKLERELEQERVSSTRS